MKEGEEFLKRSWGEDRYKLVKSIQDACDASAAAAAPTVAASASAAAAAASPSTSEPAKAKKAKLSKNTTMLATAKVRETLTKLNKKKRDSRGVLKN